MNIEMENISSSVLNKKNRQNLSKEFQRGVSVCLNYHLTQRIFGAHIELPKNTKKVFICLNIKTIRT